MIFWFGGKYRPGENVRPLPISDRGERACSIAAVYPQMTRRGCGLSQGCRDTNWVVMGIIAVILHNMGGSPELRWAVSCWHLKTVLREEPLPLTAGSLVDILACFNDPYSSLPTHPPCLTHTHTHSCAQILPRYKQLHGYSIHFLYSTKHGRGGKKCYSVSTLSHTHLLYMSRIQVLLHCLQEQGDKRRRAALYFHVKILFFHLIGLSSHSMRRRQWRYGKTPSKEWNALERRRGTDTGRRLTITKGWLKPGTLTLRSR